MPTADMIRAKRAHEREQRCKRYVRDLYALATEILGYDLLTPEFHKPICDWIVGHEGDPFTWFAAARDHYKTTLQVADLCRHMLRDPEKTHLYLHAVDDEAQKVVGEVGWHFQHNKEFRRLRPEIMPAVNAKRWMKADRFTLRRSGLERQPTLLGKSTGSEITGVHVTGSIRPDDIIGRNTIEDSGLPKVKNWWQNTIMPVRRPECVVVGSGTRWDIDDIYGEWIEDSDWNTLVHAARETDGVPDYKGRSVLYTEEELRLREKQMGPNFAPQMMNDPSPAGEKPWTRDCEQYLEPEEVRGAGLYVVLSDPAPAKVGGFKGLGEKTRRDGSKDDWATAVIKVRKNGQRDEIILMDGDFSKEWEPDDGMDKVCEYVHRFPGARYWIEAYGGLAADYDLQMRKAARRNGVRTRPVNMKPSHEAGAKNLLFARLANRAKLGEFFICTSCPTRFVNQFLSQARNWRPLPNGRNSLRFDDVANVVSFGVMEEIAKLAPQVDEREEWSPYMIPEEEENVFEGRYVRY